MKKYLIPALIGMLFFLLICSSFFLKFKNTASDVAAPLSKEVVSPKDAKTALQATEPISQEDAFSKEEKTVSKADDSVSQEESLAQETKTFLEAAVPDAKTYREETKNNLESKGVVKGIQELPISKLFFVESEQGTFIVSSDGRFVFEGVLKDVWHRKTIKDLVDAKSVERTPVSNIGFEPEKQLAHFQIGNPKLPRQGVAFVDPTSPHTGVFLKHLMQRESEVNWTVVLLPLIGGNSAIDRSRRLWCATDIEQAKLDLIEGSSKSFGKLKDDCSEKPILMGMMLTDVFQIKSLPHLIREDGLVSAGFPEKFDDWFKQP